MDKAVKSYIDDIDPAHRPLFDRIHRLILTAHPDAAVVLSYQIPTYKVGRRRLYVGAWQHGISIYGWGRTVTAALPNVIPSCGPAREPSSCARRTRPPSPTTSLPAWSARPWKPEPHLITPPKHHEGPGAELRIATYGHVTAWILRQPSRRGRRIDKEPGEVHREDPL